MKERPILFSGPMVQAILDDRKTQARRTKGLEKINQCPDEWQLLAVFPYDGYACFYNRRTAEEVRPKCPYGGAGDGLWVKETWRLSHHKDGTECPCYRADNLCQCGRPSLISVAETKWRPSILMPRRFSRLSLLNTGLRVERVQDISHKDAMAEGAGYMPAAEVRAERLTVPQIVFAGYWDSLNGKKHLWASNPWVWAPEFKRI